MSGRSAARSLDHVEGDGRVLARGRRDCEGVEELVVAEQLGKRVGAAPGVDECSERVEQAASEHERGSRPPDLLDDLLQGSDSDPAERNPKCGCDPLGGVAPNEPLADCEERAAPGDSEYRIAPD